MNLIQDAEDAVTGRAWAKIGIAVGAGIIVIVLLWIAIHRIFFAGAEAKKAKADLTVQQSIGNAAAKTGGEAVREVQKTYEYHTEQRTIVKEGQANVERATTFDAADAAGADALCRLHDSLCRSPDAAGLQPVRPAGDDDGHLPRDGAPASQ